MIEAEELRTQLSELGRMVADQLARIGELEAENAELRETVPQLQARIVELEQRLAKDSGNSSKPPSSDAPWTKPRRRGRPKKSPRGGQKGHDGRNRSFVSASEVKKFVDHLPKRCSGCATRLKGEDANPQRWQVAEIPPIQAVVTEHRLHRLVCPNCGRKNQTPRPAAMQSRFGTRVHATTAWLTGRMGVSKRQVLEILSTLLGIEVSLGSVSAMEGRMAKALDAPYAEVWQRARGSPVVHADETTWYENRRLIQLWALVTKELCFYQIQESRGTDAAKALIGEDFRGTLCTDRHGAYNWVERRGLCWAHLLRNFEKMSQAPGGKWYGPCLRNAASRIMTTWYSHARGEIDEAAMLKSMEVERRRVEKTLRWAFAQEIFLPVHRQAEAILKQEHQLWTFLDTPGLPPDNNLAERAMRRGVLWRKRSYGTNSPAGSRYAERILTAVETLRCQDRDVAGFLADAYDARRMQQPAPSLFS
jgi:transposase